MLNAELSQKMVRLFKFDFKFNKCEVAHGIMS